MRLFAGQLRLPAKSQNTGSKSAEGNLGGFDPLPGANFAVDLPNPGAYLSKHHAKPISSDLSQMTVFQQSSRVMKWLVES
jgi:hypothetical protein